MQNQTITDQNVQKNVKARETIHRLLDEMLDEDAALDRMVRKVGQTQETGTISFKLKLAYNRDDEVEVTAEGEVKPPKFKNVLIGEIVNGQLNLWGAD